MPNIFDKTNSNPKPQVKGMSPSLTGTIAPTKGYGISTWGDLLWDDKVSDELNTYRNLNPISLNHEPVLDLDGTSGKGEETSWKDREKYVFGDTDLGEGACGGAMEGRFSLFNHNNAVLNNAKAQINMNAPLYDSPSIRETIRRNSDCSVRALVDASEAGMMGRAIYRYSDFMFCKHLGKISNNYLVTLRRFPTPAGDHINYTLPPSKSNQVSNTNEFNGHQPDIGRLVTWIGTPGNEMSGILKYDVNLPYEEMTAQIQESNVSADAGSGPLAAVMNMSNKGYMKAAARGAAGASSISFVSNALPPKMRSLVSAPANTSWAYHRDMTKAYGPVDAIAKTHYRAGAEKGGIKFEHNITLTFDYELRAFDGINTRAAMLDLLGNILAVTFSNATYWGGAIHGNGPAQSNIFANLPIFHMEHPLSLATVKNSILESGKMIGAAFNNGQPINSLKDFVNAVMNFGEQFVNLAVDGMLNSLGRPQKEGLNSLLNFAPTGVWHLMIGNPKHPIMSMGNMILDNCTIEHYGPLGLDDFPTGLKVTITLKHGTPRDTMKIEHMYMNGDFRVYQPLGNQGLKAWRNAQELYQSNNKFDNADDLNVFSGTAKRSFAVDKTTSTYARNTDYENYLASMTTMDAADARIQHDRLFIKYYGTADPIDILKTNMEAHLGSEPLKDAFETQEWKDKAAAAQKRQNNQNK